MLSFVEIVVPALHCNCCVALLPCLMPCGIACVSCGVRGFFAAFSRRFPRRFPRRFWLRVCGLACLMAGPLLSRGVFLLGCVFLLFSFLLSLRFY